MDWIQTTLLTLADALAHFNPLPITGALQDRDLSLYNLAFFAVVATLVGLTWGFFRVLATSEHRSGPVMFVVMILVLGMYLPLILGTGEDRRYEYVVFVVAGLFRFVDGFACRRGVVGLRDAATDLPNHLPGICFGAAYAFLIFEHLGESIRWHEIIRSLLSSALILTSFVGLTNLIRDVFRGQEEMFGTGWLCSGCCLFVLAANAYEPTYVVTKLLFYLLFPLGVVSSFVWSSRQ